MKYAIVDATKAEEAGINLEFHRVYNGKVVLNENELLMLGAEKGISNANMSKQLGGGKLLGRLETRGKTKFWKDKKKK